MTGNKAERRIPDFCQGREVSADAYIYTILWPLGLLLLHWYKVPGIRIVIVAEPCCQFSKRPTTGLFYI